MDNFNLDNLQKKMPYKTPENFFGEMQENVLKAAKKQEPKQTKIFKINFSAVTSLAAALALIFGFAFLWKTNQTGISKPSDMADTITANMPNTSPSSETAKKSVETYKKVENNSLSTKENQLIADNENAMPEGNEDNYEQLLNSLTDEEIIELSKNSDQDIYLELYN